MDFHGVQLRCEHGRQVLGKMAAGNSRLAGRALGPREGHMTRLAARAAGAGKGEGGRRERRGQSRAVDCAVLWFFSAFAAARLPAFTPPISKRGMRRREAAWCAGINRGLRS